jgi:hypothetical protein
MPLEPSYDFEHEVRQVSTQIAKAPNFGDLATLHPRRNEVVVEAHEIVHQSNIPESRGCNFHSQPGVK